MIRHAVGEVELGSDAHRRNVGDAGLNIVDDDPDSVTDDTGLHLTSVSPARDARDTDEISGYNADLDDKDQSACATVDFGAYEFGSSECCDGGGSLTVTVPITASPPRRRGFVCRLGRRACTWASSRADARHTNLGATSFHPHLLGSHQIIKAELEPTT